ncbi:MAG: hypothetical protein NZZ41_00750 [Candidatus Dojkabacteria bacterium]|nr:hypothetical protein [Candidatus Dojkabacteria bacterium]
MKEKKILQDSFHDPTDIKISEFLVIRDLITNKTIKEENISNIVYKNSYNNKK